MDWVDRPKNYKGLYGILQLLQGSHLDNFPLKTLKLGFVAFHSLTFWLKCLDFQSNQYKKLAPALSRFCNWLVFVSCSREVMQKAGDVQSSLARELAEYEMQVEKDVLAPMTSLLEVIIYHYAIISVIFDL